jgi:homoserine O-succinyltransferase
MITPELIARDCDFEHDDSLVIGLVNNMPDAALRATERQFCELLSEAAQGRVIRLRLFSLPGIPRGREAQLDLGERYLDIGQLYRSRVDGLIVTGTEPRASIFSEEPYWPFLAQLVGWAQDHTASTLWSCLAAHAAVLERDGINRRRLGNKLFGLFECSKSVEHPLLNGIPSRWRVPHSRYNDLPEQALAARGYQILSRSTEAGADLFVKQTGSLFIFVQGHPEYDAHTLLREYRRDVQRYLTGESAVYPELPRSYFDIDTVHAVEALRERALVNRDPALFSDFPAVQIEEPSSWRRFAARLYTNWISYLAGHKCAQRELRVG